MFFHFRIEEELYKLHASILILILLFQAVYTCIMYKSIWVKMLNQQNAL